MKVKVKVTIHELLRHLSGIEPGQEVFDAQASDVLDCLSAATKRFAYFREWTYTREGTPSPQVWFFVNGERLLEEEITRSLKDGDEVLIFFNHA